MKNLLLLFIIFFLLFQSSVVIAQPNGAVKVESYFNMDTTLGVIFCGKLNHLVYDAALQGKIPVYESSNMKSEEKLDKDQVLVAGSTITSIFDESESMDTVVPRNYFSVKDVIGYYFSINWQLDTNGYSYTGIPYAFSFAYIDKEKGDTISSPLFWISITDLKTLITPTEFHQLQEAIFLHIYTNFNYTNYHIWGNKTLIEDLKSNSYRKYFFSNRLFPDLYSKQLLSMNKMLYDDAINAKVVVYNNDSMNFGSITPKEVIKWKGWVEKDTTYEIKAGILIDTIIREPFKPDSIKGNSVMELWKMDYINNKIIVQITGISVDYKMIIAGYNFGIQQLFCVPYKYVESVIGKTELLRMSNILFKSLVNNYLK